MTIRDDPKQNKMFQENVKHNQHDVITSIKVYEVYKFFFSCHNRMKFAQQEVTCMCVRWPV